jgi:hypothetical protein
MQGRRYKLCAVRCISQLIAYDTRHNGVPGYPTPNARKTRNPKSDIRYSDVLGERSSRQSVFPCCWGVKTREPRERESPPVY